VEKNGWITAFVVVVTIEIVLQTLILAGVYYGLRQASRTVDLVIDELQRKLDPILSRVVHVLQNMDETISNALKAVAEMTRLAREHTEASDRRVGDAVERLRQEIIRVDAIVTIALETVGSVGVRMRRAGLGLSPEGSARSTGIDFSAWQSVPGDQAGQPPRHEDLSTSQSAGAELLESPMNNDLNLSTDHSVSSQDKESWIEPRPQNIPRPTYSPAVLALAIVCLLWGMVTTYLISLLGAIFFILGLAGWIGELRHEHASR